MRKPFYRKQTRCWYVKDDAGRFVRLDPDERKAFRMWERLRDIKDFKHADATLEAVFEGFAADIQPQISPERFAKTAYFLETFALHYGPTKLARSVTKSAILKWIREPRQINGQKRVWSVARQRDAGQAVKRALRWAIQRQYLPWSDVMEMEFESPQPRETMITYDQHCRLVEACREPKKARPFALLLIALRLSGARPINVRELTAANVVNGQWVFRRHKTSGKTGKPLVVRCGPCLQTLTRILVHARPMGHLFRTSHGKPWPKDGLALRFRRLREKEKLEGVTAYSYRHSYATDALEAGVSIPAVAALLGHSNPAMVARVYGHLERRGDHLDEAVRAIRKNH